MRLFSSCRLATAAVALAVVGFVAPAEAGFWTPKEGQGLGYLDRGRSNPNRQIVVVNTGRGYQVDIHAPQGHTPTVQMKNLGNRNKWVRTTLQRGGNNARTMWWSGVKSPINLTKNFSNDTRIHNEFYIVTRARGGVQGMRNWILNANSGFRTNGNLKVVSNGKTYWFESYRRTNLYKGQGPRRWQQQFTWVLCMNWDNVPADAIAKAAQSRGWINGNWYLQQWHRFVELYHTDGNRTKFPQTYTLN